MSAVRAAWGSSEVKRRKSTASTWRPAEVSSTPRVESSAISTAGEQASVRPGGPLRVNNGEAVMPALLAGLGVADLPEFIVGDAIASGEVEVILKGWKQPEGAVHLVMPPGGPRPARVEVLGIF